MPDPFPARANKWTPFVNSDMQLELDIKVFDATFGPSFNARGTKNYFP